LAPQVRLTPKPKNKNERVKDGNSWGIHLIAEYAKKNRRKCANRTGGEKKEV